MTFFGCVLLLFLNLAQTRGGSMAESIQQSTDLSKLPQNSFCPGEGASSAWSGYMFDILYLLCLNCLSGFFLYQYTGCNTKRLLCQKWIYQGLEKSCYWFLNFNGRVWEELLYMLFAAQLRWKHIGEVKFIGDKKFLNHCLPLAHCSGKLYGRVADSFLQCRVEIEN